MLVAQAVANVDSTIGILCIAFATGMNWLQMCIDIAEC